MRHAAMTSPHDEVVLSAETLFTPVERLADGWVHVRGARIAGVGSGRVPDLGAPVVRLPAGSTLAPGFIDLHVHGGGGAQVGPDPKGARGRRVPRPPRHDRAARDDRARPRGDAPRHGARRGRPVARRPGPEAARVLGCHLEGPFLSPERPGALDVRHLRPPDRDELIRLLDAGAGSVQMVVVAPELPGALELIAEAADDGVVVSIGHTDATYDEAMAGFHRGARAATHLFNGMRPLHHREPGPAGAALSEPRVTAEIIADGIHVHPRCCAWPTRRRARAASRSSPTRCRPPASPTASTASATRP